MEVSWAEQTLFSSHSVQIGCRGHNFLPVGNVQDVRELSHNKNLHVYISYTHTRSCKHHPIWSPSQSRCGPGSPSRARKNQRSSRRQLGTVFSCPVVIIWGLLKMGDPIVKPCKICKTTIVFDTKSWSWWLDDLGVAAVPRWLWRPPFLAPKTGTESGTMAVRWPFGRAKESIRKRFATYTQEPWAPSWTWEPQLL